MGLVIKSMNQLMSERKILPGQQVQVFIDSETVRLMSPYTPMRTGTMRDSAFDSTEFGSGEIHQTAPYSREQYYNENFSHRGITTHHWFEAMKNNGGKAKILNGAARLSGARGIKT